MNTYADAIRRQAEDAPRAALPAVAKALWTAFAAGQITEAEAGALSVLIESRQASGAAHNGGQSPNPRGTGHHEGTGEPRKLVQVDRAGVGSRPRTDASMERRRRWAASGRLPPALAARFTLAEHAVLALVAAETARRGDCRLTIGHVAAVVGVSRSTVKAAIREAKALGLLTVEERRATGFRNMANIIRIVSPEWTAWLRLARKGAVLDTHPSLAKGRGVKSSTSTPTQVSEQGKTGSARPLRRPAALPNPSPRGTVRIAGA